MSDLQTRSQIWKKNITDCFSSECQTGLTERMNCPNCKPEQVNNWQTMCEKSGDCKHLRTKRKTLTHQAIKSGKLAEEVIRQMPAFQKALDELKKHGDVLIHNNSKIRDYCCLRRCHLAAHSLFQRQLFLLINPTL